MWRQDSWSFAQTRTRLKPQPQTLSDIFTPRCAWANFSSFLCINNHQVTEGWCTIKMPSFLHSVLLRQGLETGAIFDENTVSCTTEHVFGIFDQKETQRIPSRRVSREDGLHNVQVSRTVPNSPIIKRITKPSFVCRLRTWPKLYQNPISNDKGFMITVRLSLLYVFVAFSLSFC